MAVCRRGVGRGSSSSLGAVISDSMWSCELGQQQQQQPHHEEARDYLQHQGNSTGFTRLYASIEDLVFVSYRRFTCVLSPTRFPGQWKVLPMNLGSLVHLFATRIPGELLLLGVERGGRTLRFCFRQGCWTSTCIRAPMFPLGRSVLFQGAFYFRSMEHRTLRGSWDDKSDSDDELEPDVFSVMRFRLAMSRWEEVELSERDKGILNSGIFHLLLLQGRLLVFLLPWPYLESRGCQLQNAFLEAVVIGRLMVFELVDEDDDGESRNKMKLVDVSGDFGKALELATQQNATNFFNSDADNESGEFFWITSRGDLSGFSTLRNEATMAEVRMHRPPEFNPRFIIPFHYWKHLHHTDTIPPGEQSLMSHFSGLKDLKFQLSQT